MRTLLLALSLTICCQIWADMPGNKPRPDVWIQFTNTAHFTEYEFYYQAQRADNKMDLLKDTSYLLDGGYGVPKGAMIYGINKKTKEHTDTLYVYNQRSGMIFHLDSVENGKMKFSETEIPVTLSAEKVVVEKKENHLQGVNMIMLISLTAIALMGLIAFFVMKKKS